jgi:hypothetical protein
LRGFGDIGLARAALFSQLVDIDSRVWLGLNGKGLRYHQEGSFSTVVAS